MINEMNEGIIKRWNDCIKPNDAVYHLGDFCLTVRTEYVDEWLGQLNGEIRLIKGNHDNWVKRLDRLENRDKIKWVKDYAERTFSIGGQKHKIVMSHFPMLFWHRSHYGSIMLHGHCHGNAQEHNEGLRRMDVGVDANGWYPVPLENIITLMENVPLNPHHERYNER
jgi:calcineurin-like phosphoesterase family protein